VVREFGEYVGHETVGSRHEIVEDEETGFSAIEDGVRLCRQTLAEIDASLVVAGDVRSVVLVEFRLPLAVTVPYPLYRRFEKFAVEYCVDQPEDEYRLTASGRAGDEKRAGCISGNIGEENDAKWRLYTFFRRPRPPLPPPRGEGGEGGTCRSETTTHTALIYFVFTEFAPLARNGW